MPAGVDNYFYVIKHIFGNMLINNPISLQICVNKQFEAKFNLQYFHRPRKIAIFGLPQKKK